MKQPHASAECDSEDEGPGVPGFRTWRGVYWFVFAWFMLVVILLALFTRAFA
jgi:hypothetical protein